MENGQSVDQLQIDYSSRFTDRFLAKLNRFRVRGRITLKARFIGVVQINVRTFAWHDLITLYRYRSELLPLDGTRLLTRGSPIGLAAVMTDFHPAYGSCNLVARGGKGNPKLIGKMLYRMGARSARLTYILPYSAAGSLALNLLLEQMARMAGQWGACNILAELNEDHVAFDPLRRAGFIVYAWQKVWRFLPQLNEQPNSENTHAGDRNGRGKKKNIWRPSTSSDEVAIRNLYHNLVPPLVQGAESSPGQRQPGLVYRQDGELLGYIEANYGPRGIFLNPLIHPSVDDAPGLLNSLRHSLSPLFNRPVYLAVRSYQAWLETFLQQMDAEVSPRQGLLVKHLVTLQHVPATANARLSVIDNVTAETSAPLVRNIQTENKE